MWSHTFLLKRLCSQPQSLYISEGLRQLLCELWVRRWGLLFSEYNSSLPCVHIIRPPPCPPSRKTLKTPPSMQGLVRSAQLGSRGQELFSNYDLEWRRAAVPSASAPCPSPRRSPLTALWWIRNCHPGRLSLVYKTPILHLSTTAFIICSTTPFWQPCNARLHRT